jgi:hypothetical protein
MLEDAPQFAGPEVEQQEQQPVKSEMQETAISEAETQANNTGETSVVRPADSPNPEEVDQSVTNYELHRQAAAELARETNYYELLTREVAELRELSEKADRAFFFRHIRDEEKGSAEIVDAFKQLIDERINQELIKSFDVGHRLDQAQKTYDTALAKAATHFEENQGDYHDQATQEMAEQTKPTQEATENEKVYVVNKATELATRNQKLTELGDPKVKSIKVDVTDIVKDTMWGRYLRDEGEKISAAITSRPMLTGREHGEDKWNWIHVEGYIQRPGEDKSSGKFTMLELQVNADGSFSNRTSYDDQGKLPEPGTPEFTSLSGVLDTLSQAYDKVESQLLTNA